MAIMRNIFKLSNIVGIHRNLLSSRIILPTHQPAATIKRKLVEELGLPVEPKKPLTVYLKFLKQIRPSIVKKHPDLRSSEIVKIMALEWQKADKSIKEKLEKEYERSLEEYHEARVNYLNSMTDEQKQVIENFKITQKATKLKKSHKEAIKSLGKPKRPESAFSRFSRSVALKRGDQPLSEWMKMMKAKWETLTQEEKKVFESETAKAKEEYAENMKLWLAKMSTVHDDGITRNEKSKESTE